MNAAVDSEDDEELQIITELPAKGDQMLDNLITGVARSASNLLMKTRDSFIPSPIKSRHSKNSLSLD